MASVVESLQLAGGALPADETAFWQELAANLGLTPRSRDVSRIAQTVLNELDEEWDDDFVEDGLLSLSLYETLAAAAARYARARERGEGEEEEEDDEGLAGFRSDLHITPTTFGLQTVHQWIQDGLLVLSPEWQRNFVWKAKKQKRLVESILMGLPIPSFLIFEESASGRKYVIDGRQRLETIARFKAPREERGAPRLRFRTFGRKEAGWEPDDALGEAAGKYYDQLPQKFKTRFDSAPLVLSEFRDIELHRLYQVFRRYNTGAVALNAAEIRNAVYQASPLHEMMFRLGGEQRPAPQYVDADEERVSTDLRETMGNKRQRYGAYDFIGRYFAFAYGERSSVAKATVEFMEKFDDSEPSQVERLRREFIRVFRKTYEWYPSSFLRDPEEGRVHAFLGTLQLVSTKFALEHVEAGRTTEEAARNFIVEKWGPFAQNRLARKQNSTFFWGSQKTWVSMLESGLGLTRRYPTWDWELDLLPPEGEVQQ